MKTHPSRLDQLLAWLSLDDGRRFPRALTVIWGAFSAVHITIWGLVCAFSGDLDYPWWAWPVVPAGIAVAALWWLTSPSGSHAASPKTTAKPLAD